MYGSNSEFRLSPLGWLLLLGATSLVALTVAQLFGVADLFAAAKAIVLTQAAVMTCAVLFLILADAFAGPDLEAAQRAERAAWLHRPEEDWQPWREAVQARLSEMSREIDAAANDFEAASSIVSVPAAPARRLQIAEESASVASKGHAAVTARRAPPGEKSRRAA